MVERENGGADEEFQCTYSDCEKYYDDSASLRRPTDRHGKMANER